MDRWSGDGWAIVAILVGGAVGICGTAWAIENMENVDLKSATPICVCVIEAPYPGDPGRPVLPDVQYLR